MEDDRPIDSLTPKKFVFTRWLPLSEPVLSMVVSCLFAPFARRQGVKASEEEVLEK